MDGCILAWIFLCRQPQTFINTGRRNIPAVHLQSTNKHKKQSLDEFVEALDFSSYRRLSVELLFHIDDTLAQISFGFNLTRNLLNGIHHCGVIAAAKHFANHWQRGIRFFSHKIHGNLPRLGDFLRAVTPKQSLHTGLPFVGHQFDDLLRSNVLMLRQKVSQRNLDQLRGQGGTA